MKILKFKIYHNNPLIVGGINEIKSEFPKPLQIIIGENGCGKSTLLRELTPLPAIRTDYAPDGYKEIQFEHNSFIYTTKSNFANKTKVHSFKKDGVELNESGTSEIQRQLCEQHFGLTTFVQSLINNEYDYCKMSKSERKSLFLTTYPSDLTFMLDYHKKVCSKIREYKNQLTLLQEKEVSLKNKLLEKTILDRLKDYKKDLEHLNICLDQDIFIVSQKLKEFTELLKKEKSTITLEELKTTFRKWKGTLAQYRTYHPELFNDNSTNEQITTITTELTNIDNAITNVSDELFSIKNTIEEYREQSSKCSSDYLNQIQSEIDYLTDKIKKIFVDMNIPILEKAELSDTKEIVSKITNILDHIHSSDVRIWDSRTYKNALVLFDKWKYRYDKLVEEGSVIKEQIEYYQNKIYKDTKLSYPTTCTFNCQLKNKLDFLINESKAQLHDLSIKLEPIKQEVKEYKTKLKKLQNCISHNENIHSSVVALEKIINSHSCFNWILQGKSLSHTLNKCPFNISNRLLLVIENSENKIERDKYVNELDLLKIKLTTLQNTQLPAKELIQKVISDSEYKHKKLEEKLINLNITKTIKSKELITLKGLQSLKNDIESLSSIATQYAKTEYLRLSCDFLNTLLSEYQESKIKINNELTSVNSDVSEQEKYLIRLNEEILPSIKEITSTKNKWELVEKALSPNNGVPHIYLVRHLNNILIKANRYISQVWGYGLELKYLNENEPLDFSFSVIINHTNEVKDIGLCSTAQKAMINLALTLSICDIRGFNKVYPIKLDEVDAGFSETHRANLIKLLGMLVSNVGIENTDKITQIILVNHYASLYADSLDGNIICLNDRGIMLPSEYNTNTILA